MEQGRYVPRETICQLVLDFSYASTDQWTTEQYPEWRFESNQLVGEWKLANFAELKQVIQKLCDLADELNHHPTVTYGYSTLRIETTTHDAGNQVTEKDIEFAGRTSQLLSE